MAKLLKDPITQLTRLLRTRSSKHRRRRHRIPAVWNRWGYSAAKSAGPGEVLVDPHDFLLSCLERVILPAMPRRRISGQSLSQIRETRRHKDGMVLADGRKRRGGDWMKTASAYGMLVRATTAWDHNGDGKLTPAQWTETGTFLKTILVLPLLQQMGINTLYLLPVTRCSRVFRKGELGCPYSAQNFFELEPDLHDRLLGPDFNDLSMEFAAFVDAAHVLGMRVMVDLAPRTASRDSDLILDHPEWFYWIDRRAAKSFGPPHIDGFEPGIPTPSQLGDLLTCDVVRRHLACFRHAPNVADPIRWKRFVQRCRLQSPKDLVKALGREFGVITPPGFSDCVNDPQPPWSDVTFLRLYLDHPAASAKHLADCQRQPPYVFTDTIKASLFPGKRPNRRLWKTLAGILPFYQRFGIDGARVDMGHALPTELQDMLIAAPRRKDPDFGFLAEEFDYGKARAARRSGYNALLGTSWHAEPRANEGHLHRLVHVVLPKTRLPSLVSAETPDTPRAVMRQGGKTFARTTAVLNNFLPGGIPFVHSGFEMFERQPLNLGLDMLPSGRNTLKKSDPNYGKLGYFDRVNLHWTKPGSKGMIGLIARAADLRQEYLPELSDLRNYFQPQVAVNARRILAVGWKVRRKKRVLLVVANLDSKHARRTIIGRLPAVARPPHDPRILLEVTTSRTIPRVGNGKVTMQLSPGDVKVLLL
ncbi:MAG: alpha-amylase [Phycisphaerae bacterium]